jgi:hypothetical protein
MIVLSHFTWKQNSGSGHGGSDCAVPSSTIKPPPLELVVCVANPVDYLKDDFLPFKCIDHPETDKINEIGGSG